MDEETETCRPICGVIWTPSVLVSTFEHTKQRESSIYQYHSISITVPLCHSITVSQYQYQYHSTTVSASVSQNHRLHCTKPLRHSKGAIWAKRTGFNFCWLPLTNSYQIPLLQALTTKVSKILPNPLCVQQQQKKTSSSSANKRDTILEIRSTSPSMNNGCEE